MTVTITNTDKQIFATLTGRLDTAAAPQFARDIDPLMTNAHKHIILDCQNLEFVSSSGLRLLLSLRKQTIAMGGDVTIKGVNNDVKQVFTITGFYSLFNFVD